MKPVRVRPHAGREIDALADFIAQDDLNAALRFLDLLQGLFEMLGEQPGIGSLRFVHLPMLEELRSVPYLGSENHLVFYIDRPAYIDIIRVLHSARDLPAALQQ